jgi:hypothetical protein
MAVVAATLATHRNAALDDWYETAVRCGYEPRILGLGEKWTGFRQKLEHYYKEAQRLASERGPDAVLLLTDAYDLLFNAPAQQSLKVLESSGKPIVTGMQIGCFSTCCAGAMPVQSKFKHVNSGVIIGQAAVLAQALHDALETHVDDDQLAWSKVCLQRNDIAFDVQRRLVANLEVQDNYTWDPTHNAITVDSVQPCVVHFPCTVCDFLKRESFCRRHLIGPHRAASFSEVGRVFWNKFRVLILVGIAALVGLAVVVYSLSR